MIQWVALIGLIGTAIVTSATYILSPFAVSLTMVPAIAAWFTFVWVRTEIDYHSPLSKEYYLVVSIVSATYIALAGLLFYLGL